MGLALKSSVEKLRNIRSLEIVIASVVTTDGCRATGVLLFLPGPLVRLQDPMTSTNRRI